MCHLEKEVVNGLMALWRTGRLAERCLSKANALRPINLLTLTALFGFQWLQQLNFRKHYVTLLWLALEMEVNRYYISRVLSQHVPSSYRSTSMYV
jgi:hypothetical protein